MHNNDLAVLPIRKKTITTTATETWAAALKRLASGIDFSTISTAAHLEMGFYQFSLAIYAGNAFGGVTARQQPSISAIDLLTVEFNASVALLIDIRSSASGNQYIDESNNAVGGAYSFTLWY